MFRLVVLLATLVAVASSASIPTPDVAIESLFNGRIIGGNVTDISKYPHQVSMRFKYGPESAFNHRCGGSIISSRIILTAAQCVYRMDPKTLNVVAGTSLLNGEGAIVPVEKVIWHEYYSRTVERENNVAILVLGADLPLNGYDIRPIKMVDKKPAPGAKSTATGWGRTTESGKLSSYLMEVSLPIIANHVCEDIYGPSRINESMLCAGSVEGGIDACHGDAGGPLVVGNQLAGIVSWRDSCASKNQPGLYSNVAYLRSWIDNAIKVNS